MIHLFFAVLTLSLIIAVSLRVGSLWLKLLCFVALGALNAVQLSLSGHAAEVLEVCWSDYLPFIPVPLCAVLTAGLGLFDIIVKGSSRQIGWFLLLACPLIGNFATTWSLVPIAISLVGPLRTAYPSSWKSILIALAIFGMNLLALGTLAADPPQAYWAVKAGETGAPLPFLFPAARFWPYLLCTMALYAMVLRGLGVEFGGLLSLFRIRPESWPRIVLGVAAAASLGLAISHLRGHQVTAVVGGVCVALALVASLFRKPGGLFGFTAEERHQSLEWCLETAAIFVGFFSLVAQAHVAIDELKPPLIAMVPVVAGMTAWADNAAAFAVAYPVYEKMPPDFMVWFNLFPSVVFGGSTPLGNGPQIILLLVILVGKKEFTPGEVFSRWFAQVAALLVYLVVWVVCIAVLIERGVGPGPEYQFPIGAAALLSWGVARRLMTPSLPARPELLRAADG